jgi:hypothetical protein
LHGNFLIIFKDSLIFADKSGMKSAESTIILESQYASATLAQSSVGALYSANASTPFSVNRLATRISARFAAAAFTFMRTALQERCSKLT